MNEIIRKGNLPDEPIDLFLHSLGENVRVGKIVGFFETTKVA